MRVFVTGAGALLGQGIIRSLRLCDPTPEIVAADPSPYSAGLYWADRACRLPMAADPEYMDRLRDLLRSERPDALLVGTDTELPVIAPHRHELEAEFGVKVIVSDPRVIDIANDKYLTFEFLREQGLPYPDSALPGEEESLVDRVGFPLIVKPRIGARSVGVHRVTSRAELQRALAGAGEVVIQECVSTEEDEYTAGVLHFPDQPTVSIVMRRHLRDGNTYRAFVEEYPELNERVRAVAVALAPYGPANFQFRVADGVMKIFEINARFSGTTPLRARAGFNEVAMTLAHVLEGKPLEQPPVRPAVFLRYWEEAVVEPATIAAVAAVPLPGATPLG